MSRLIYRNILTLFGVLVIAGFFYYQWKTTLHGPKLRVLGWQFVAEDIEWQSVAGYQVVDVALHPDRGRGRFQFNNHGLKSLCQAVVDGKPEMPDNLIETDGIIKVNLTVPAKYLGEHARDLFLEVPVQQGQCPNLNNVNNYDVFLPYPMHEWRAEIFKIFETDEGRRVVVTYAWKGEADAPFDDFDFELACRIFIGAPYANYAQKLAEMENPRVEIQAKQIYGISIANVSRGHSQRFDTAGNACIERGEQIDL